MFRKTITNFGRINRDNLRISFFSSSSFSSSYYFFVLFSFSKETVLTKDHNKFFYVNTKYVSTLEMKYFWYLSKKFKLTRCVNQRYAR